MNFLLIFVWCIFLRKTFLYYYAACIVEVNQGYWKALRLIMVISTAEKTIANPLNVLFLNRRFNLSTPLKMNTCFLFFFKLKFPTPREKLDPVLPLRYSSLLIVLQYVCNEYSSHAMNRLTDRLFNSWPRENVFYFVVVHRKTLATMSITKLKKSKTLSCKG